MVRKASVAVDWLKLSLRLSEAVDHLRVVPRLVLGAYGFYVGKVTFFILYWYASQPKDARGAEETAVVIAVITAVTGFAPWIYRIYSDSATDWSSRKPTTVTTVAATTTTTGPAPAA